MRKNVGEEVQPVKEWLERKNQEHGLRPDKPLQRYAKQWKPWQTGNLIRRILEEKRIPNILIAEQDDPFHPGCTISWLLDGKQRITTIERYINNEDVDVEYLYSYQIVQTAIWLSDVDSQLKNSNGVASVSSNGRSVSFRSLAELTGNDMPSHIKAQLPHHAKVW